MAGLRFFYAYSLATTHRTIVIESTNIIIFMRQKLLLVAAALLCSVGIQNAHAAAIDFLTGWTEVTSLPTDNSELSKYYYVFVATEADLMLAQEYGTGKIADGEEAPSPQENLLTMVYRTPSNPLIAKKFVWMLSYDNTYLYGIRNLNNSTHYMQSREKWPWRVQFNWETSQSQWTQWQFAYADGKWTIQNKLSAGNGGGDTYYIGPWIAKAFADNNVVAGNKEGDNVGKFKIYRISRESFGLANVDVTSTYLTNPSFEYSASGTTATAGAISSSLYGWTVPTLSGNSNKSFGSSSNCNGEAAGIPYASDGSMYYFNRNGWNGSGNTYTLSSSTTLPAGSYILQIDYKGVDSYNNGNTGKGSTIVLKATKGSDLNSVESATFESYNVENTNTTRDNYFVTKGWTTLNVPFTVDAEGSVTFSIVQNMKGGVRTDIVIDNVRLFYTNSNVHKLAALISQASSINEETDNLTSAISTAQTVYDGINYTSGYQSTIDGAISTLNTAISTAVTGISMNHGDDISYIIANNGFETSPTFDGSSLGSSNSANATPAVGIGSSLLLNAANVYIIDGWELMTTETSDFARSFTMPYETILYVKGNNTAGGQAVAAPSNGSSVTVDNENLLFVEANWCENAVLGVQQTIPLPAGTYRLTFDSYVTTTLENASSLCGISYGETTDYKWPASTNTWTNNEIEFVLDEQTNVTISMGYKKTANVGGGSSAFLFVDNLKLTYYNTDVLAHQDDIIENNGDITSLVTDNDFQSDPTSTDWEGGGWIHWVGSESWRGGSDNKYYERGEDGSLSYTLRNMPAGTYKVVAAARGYDGGAITPEIAGTTGSTLVCVGNGVGENRSEINLNGVEMPYSDLGGFTSYGTGHNWRWITATGTLSAAGSLVINFNCVGTGWMAIDDVHLYCTHLDANATDYTQTLSTISSNTSVTNTGNASVVTCDIKMSNPNAIISSSAAINGATGTQINNNLVSGTIANLVLYDGTYGYTAPDGSYAATAAKLYRNIAADSWSTLVLPFVPTTSFTYKKVPSDLDEDGVLTFGDATPANDAPMLVKNSSALTEITGARESGSTSDLTAGSDVPMQGVYARQTVPVSTGNHYYYIVGADDNQLHKVTGDAVYISAFRAYFDLNDGASVKGNTILMNFADNTGVKSIDQELHSNDDAVIYNLAGQRMSRPLKGINIINGKKVLVK